MIPASEVSAAKKVSLSNKKLTVTKGKSKTLKVKNTKKKGTAKVQAMVGKKKLTCKVTVKNVKTSKTTPAPPVTTTPSATPLANSTNDAEALKNLIAEQKKQGASSELSEDIQNSKQYTWKNGRLVGIDWRKVELKGELSTEKFSALHYLYCNNNQLSSLDVTKNTKLLDDAIRCDANVVIIRNNN